MVVFEEAGDAVSNHKYLLRQEVLDELRSLAGEDGFWVELHPLNRQFPVLDCHDLMVVEGFRCYGELTRHAFPINNKAVVPGSSEGIRYSAEDSFSTMLDGAGFSMAEFLGFEDFSSEGMYYSLVSEADT